jgi:Zn-dependent protease with chaperone function
MNLLAGILILLCLAGSEMTGFEAADDLWIRLLAVAVTALVVPGMAFFQTAVLLRKMRSDAITYDAKRSLCRRMTACHAVVWLSASLAIIWALRWQDVVRGNWQLNQWPLIDELMILAPVVFSMVASWAIFYELQVAMAESDGPRPKQTRLKNRSWHPLATTIQAMRPRLEFISIRFRLYFLLVLLPISFFVLARDLATISTALPDSVAALLYGIGFVAVLVFFPLLILFIWKTSQINPKNLRMDLLSICQQNHLRVLDVRRWDTGNQVINAVVVGMVPRFRLILLSDGLLRHFETPEIQAVLRHEAGHIRLWHLPTRLLFMALPLVALAICDSQGLAIQSSADNMFNWLGPPLLPLTGLAVYVLLTTMWLSHKMEYEADIYSIQSDWEGPATESQTTRPICPDRASDMRNALLRLAAISPSELDRRTFFHPSIRDRIDFIERVTESAPIAARFKLGFARRRLFLAFLLLLVCALMVALLRT